MEQRQPRKNATIPVLLVALVIASAQTLSLEAKEAAGGKKQSEGAKMSFSSESWFSAKKSPNWSRKSLMEAFCQQYGGDLNGKKMDRSKVLTLLGQPEKSYEYPQWDDEASKPKPSEITDHYQITDKGGDFSITYEPNGTVRSFQQSDESFEFTMFLGPSSKQPEITVEQARKTAGLGTITAVKKLLGAAQEEELDVPPNFPTPFRFSSYMWNLSSDGRKILWVRTSGSFSEPQDKRSIDVVCIITLSSDCPVK